MQALIRATPAERFPDVGRFHEVHRHGSFNSAAWVAGFILEQLVHGPDAEADPGPPTVRLRVPDEH